MENQRASRRAIESSGASVGVEAAHGNQRAWRQAMDQRRVSWRGGRPWRAAARELAWRKPPWRAAERELAWRQAMERCVPRRRRANKRRGCTLSKRWRRALRRDENRHRAGSIGQPDRRNARLGAAACARAWPQDRATDDPSRVGFCAPDSSAQRNIFRPQLRFSMHYRFSHLPSLVQQRTPIPTKTDRANGRSPAAAIYLRNRRSAT